MKKLKTWQIVLLVIFYPVGICVLIYRLWKKNELKKEAAEAARLQAEEKARKEAEREEARRREEAYRATLNREIFRVVGVTFKNPGGRSLKRYSGKSNGRSPRRTLFPSESMISRASPPLACSTARSKSGVSRPATSIGRSRK